MRAVPPLSHEQLDAEGLSLLFGPQRTRTLLTGRCLEGIPGYLRGSGWVLVGANRDVNGDYGLDGYLKRWIKRRTANWDLVSRRYRSWREPPLMRGRLLPADVVAERAERAARPRPPQAGRRRGY
jgi:hypothetical protein